MAIKLKTTITGSVKGDCPSHSIAKCSVRDVEMTIDEPVERGGTNEGLTPTEVAVAALIGCTNVISHKCADKLGVDLGHLNVEAKYDLDRRGVLVSEEVDVPFPKMVLNIVAEGVATETDLQQGATELAKYCAVSKVFREAGSEIIEYWSKA